MNNLHKNNENIYQFLRGRGEMSELTLKYDWSNSQLGAIEKWSPILRITLGMILSSKFPMFLFWGTDLICFYNDGYRPSLGNDGKHPFILGMKGEEGWSEIWSIIKPLIEKVIQEREAIWSEDQLIPIYRNGKIEDVYWTFSYSPVIGESGTAEGVLVTCMDTTDKVINLKKIEEANNQFQFAIEAAEMGTWDYKPLTHKFTANDRFKRWFGLENRIEITWHDTFENIRENDRQLVTQTVEASLFNESGAFEIEYTILHPKTKVERIVRAKGKIWLNEDKIAYRINGTLQDITKSKLQESDLNKMATHLKLATDSADVGTWSLDLQTSILDWSEVHKKMWGYDEKRDDLLYEDWYRIILSGDREKAFEKVEEARIHKTVYDAEYRIKKENFNEIRWIRSIGQYQYDELGNAQILTGISIDITDFKQKEERLKESEARFRLLADIMPQQIWAGDEQGNLNYFSKTVYAYSGLTFEQIQKDGWIQIVHPDDRENNIQKWIHSISTGEDFFIEHRFKNYNGEYRWQLSRALPYRNSEGKILMWVGTSTDIHEQKIKEQQKDEFISIASHEMKTPLTTAHGYLELIILSLEEENISTTSFYAQKANQALDKLHLFVSELLDVSKIQNGKLNYNISIFDFNEMIDETIENIQHSTKTHTLQKTGKVSKEVKGDKNRLQQVVINLLTNAVKYSPKANKVLIEIEEKEKILQVSIRDFGVGIPKQHLSKVFERYYRVQDHAVSFQGLGIGLYISYDIINRHEGNIWVESELNIGSTFYFTLPL